jgi:hypothetical protein
MSRPARRRKATGHHNIPLQAVQYVVREIESPTQFALEMLSMGI